MTTTGVGAGAQAADGTVGQHEPAVEEAAPASPDLAAEAVEAAVLYADRAEAAAQLEAALATLGEEPPSPVASAGPDDIRRAAEAVVAAEGEVERAEEALAELPAGDPEALPAAEEAVADAQAARAALPAARRRAVGGIISGTGGAIVIAALGWHPGWYALPVILVGLLLADLRAAVSASRYASVRASQQLAELGVAGPDGLDRALARQREWEATKRRVEGAHRRRDAARARWEELAPGTDPADAEALVEQLAAEARAAAEAARPEVPDAVRTLAEKLAEEARQEIARTEQALTEMAQRLGLGPVPPAVVAAALAARAGEATG